VRATGHNWVDVLLVEIASTWGHDWKVERVRAVISGTHLVQHKLAVKRLMTSIESPKELWLTWEIPLVNPPDAMYREVLISLLESAHREILKFQAGIGSI
jgi:hypothetical protein